MKATRFGWLHASCRMAINIAALGIGVLGGSFAARDAHAAYAICRTDPVVTLSNGAQVTMYADIQDASSDIKGVQYVLHAPTTTKVTKITYDSNYGKLEHFQFVNDLGGNTYRTLTTVTTGSQNIPVTAYARVAGVNCNVTQQQAGISNQLIAFPFNC